NPSANPTGVQTLEVDAWTSVNDDPIAEALTSVAFPTPTARAPDHTDSTLAQPVTAKGAAPPNLDAGPAGETRKQGVETQRGNSPVAFMPATTAPLPSQVPQPSAEAAVSPMTVRGPGDNGAGVAGVSETEPGVTLTVSSVSTSFGPNGSRDAISPMFRIG